MPDAPSPGNPSAPPRIRWWPGAILLCLTIAAVLWVRLRSEWAFQQRNLEAAKIIVVSIILLLVWWTFFSRAANRLRLSITFGSITLVLLLALLFRVQGVSGDLLPILEFRWSSKPPSAPLTAAHPAKAPARAGEDFPQFLGPNRDGVLSGPDLETNWLEHPPEIVWRQPVGAAWSGFAIVGDVCLTQEQRGEDECVAAYEVLTGKPIWVHMDRARYNTTIAGEGPRATPTVRSNRVYACGATGILNCLDLATGKVLWSRNAVAEFDGKVPQWGLASSPLVAGERVIVHGGEKASHSLHAFRIEDGQSAWSAGSRDGSYASPMLATLAGALQVLAFNNGSISGHDPVTGAALWERPWGNGNVVCSTPLIVSSNRVLFSSGYGVGAELLQIDRGTNGRCTAEPVWRSIRMKAKFSHLFTREGCLFGLDDGIFACVALEDGSQRWKEGRYGHGQGLVAGDFYLLLAESGEVVLLRPTPEAPNELGRFRLFNSKTWNPPALSGDLLLARNDREAVCVKLKTSRK
jgi:outer membrane protein assembly factor BamB